LTGTWAVPPTRDRQGHCLPGGRKGYNIEMIYLAGKPFDLLRAVSGSV